MVTIVLALLAINALSGLLMPVAIGFCLATIFSCGTRDASKARHPTARQLAATRRHPFLPLESIVGGGT